MTMLHYASKAGAHGLGDEDEACRVVRMLHTRGADVFIRCRWTNMAALHYATYFDVGRVVSELLEVSEAMGELDCEGVGWWVCWLVCESMIWLVYMRVGWWVSWFILE